MRIIGVEVDYATIPGIPKVELEFDIVILQ
jgi:hypothetical protein